MPDRVEVCGVLGERADRDAGVGNHDIRNTDAGDEVGSGGAQGSGVGDIERVFPDLAGPARRQLVQQRRPPGDEPELRTAGGVVLGQRAADARGRTRDEDAQRCRRRSSAAGRWHPAMTQVSCRFQVGNGLTSCCARAGPWQ
ncbi:MAG: hypothetical protein AW07_01738 [Candidatus Accumulibacter sp. SK-11]|nr:MAG: hypothetical protein AW07_01738 [Candidatus Accumulibacter sp. SK-11]